MLDWRLSVVFLGLLPALLFASNYSIGDTLKVVAINGLQLREAPSSASESLTILPSGQDVVIKDTLGSSALDTIFGFKGKWVEIELN